MRPNVSSLGVNPENGLEASIEGWQRRSVAGVQEVVVLQPVGQVLEVTHIPGSLPHLQIDAVSKCKLDNHCKRRHLHDEFLGLLGRLVSQSAQTQLLGHLWQTDSGTHVLATKQHI